MEEASISLEVDLDNLAPTVEVTERDGDSFRRVVNITGSAYDGKVANSYATDEMAQWDQRGYVHSIQV